MLAEPKCFERKCKYFIGVKWLGDEEISEVCICEAFPDGIPDDITYGKNKHLKKVKGDHGIQYEKEI